MNTTITAAIAALEAAMVTPQIGDDLEAMGDILLALHQGEQGEAADAAQAAFEAEIIFASPAAIAREVDRRS